MAFDNRFPSVFSKYDKQIEGTRDNKGEDGYDLGTYYFNTEKSEVSSVPKTGETVGKWRSVWLNIPKGKHYYTFMLPNIEDNSEKTVYIRIKEWEEEQ